MPETGPGLTVCLHYAIIEAKYPPSEDVSMIRPPTHLDRSSRAAGQCTFLAGIAMLGLVFFLAYHLFTQPVPGLNLTVPPQSTPPPAAGIGLALTSFFERLLLLALLTLVGSLVASKGIHLVFTAAHGHGAVHETTTPASRNGLPPLPAASTEAVPPESATH